MRAEGQELLGDPIYRPWDLGLSKYLGDVEGQKVAAGKVIKFDLKDGEHEAINHLMVRICIYVMLPLGFRDAGDIVSSFRDGEVDVDVDEFNFLSWRVDVTHRGIRDADIVPFVSDSEEVVIMNYAKC